MFTFCDLKLFSCWFCFKSCVLVLTAMCEGLKQPLNFIHFSLESSPVFQLINVALIDSLPCYLGLHWTKLMYCWVRHQTSTQKHIKDQSYKDIFPLWQLGLMNIREQNNTDVTTSCLPLHPYHCQDSLCWDRDL